MLMALVWFVIYTSPSTNAEKCDILKICANNLKIQEFNEDNHTVRCMIREAQNSSKIIDRSRENKLELMKCSSNLKTYIQENASIYHTRVLNLLNLDETFEDEDDCKNDLQCFTCLMFRCLDMFQCNSDDCMIKILKTGCYFIREYQEVKRKLTNSKENYSCRRTKQIIVSESWEHLLRYEYQKMKQNISKECYSNISYDENGDISDTNYRDMIVSWIVGVSLICVGFLYLTGFIFNWLLVLVFLHHKDISQNGIMIILNILISNILASFFTNHLVLNLFLWTLSSPGYIFMYFYYTFMGLNIFSVVAFSVKRNSIFFDYDEFGERKEKSSYLNTVSTK